MKGDSLKNMSLFVDGKGYAGCQVCRAAPDALRPS